MADTTAPMDLQMKMDLPLDNLIKMNRMQKQKSPRKVPNGAAANAGKKSPKRGNAPAAGRRPGPAAGVSKKALTSLNTNVGAVKTQAQNRLNARSKQSRQNLLNANRPGLDATPVKGNGQQSNRVRVARPKKTVVATGAQARPKPNKQPQQQQQQKPVVAPPLRIVFNASASSPRSAPIKVQSPKPAVKAMRINNSSNRGNSNGNMNRNNNNSRTNGNSNNNNNKNSNNSNNNNNNSKSSVNGNNNARQRQQQQQQRNRNTDRQNQVNNRRDLAPASPQSNQRKQGQNFGGNQSPRQVFSGNNRGGSGNSNGNRRGRGGRRN